MTDLCAIRGCGRRATVSFLVAERIPASSRWPEFPESLDHAYLGGESLSLCEPHEWLATAGGSDLGVYIARTA